MPPTTNVGQKWWVIQRPSGARGGPPVTQAINGMKQPSGSIAGPFSSLAAARQWITGHVNKQPGFSIPNPGKIVQGWFGGLGGMIGSGIEAGFIQSLSDIWDVIIGPAEVILGFLVAAFVLVVYFKDDILAGVGMLAKVMAVAA